MPGSSATLHHEASGPIWEKLLRCLPVRLPTPGFKLVAHFSL